MCLYNRHPRNALRLTSTSVCVHVCTSRSVDFLPYPHMYAHKSLALDHYCQKSSLLTPTMHTKIDWRVCDARLPTSSHLLLSSMCRYVLLRQDNEQRYTATPPKRFGWVVYLGAFGWARLSQHGPAP